MVKEKRPTFHLFSPHTPGTKIIGHKRRIRARLTQAHLKKNLDFGLPAHPAGSLRKSYPASTTGSLPPTSPSDDTSAHAEFYFFRRQPQNTSITMADRGRGGGFGSRGGDRGRGRGRGRGRRGGKSEEKEWQPVTKLGRLVKAGKINSMEEIYLHSLPIKEFQIVDNFLPKLKDEVMKVRETSKTWRQLPRFDIARLLSGNAILKEARIQKSEVLGPFGLCMAEILMLQDCNWRGQCAQIPGHNAKRNI